MYPGACEVFERDIPELSICVASFSRGSLGDERIGLVMQTPVFPCRSSVQQCEHAVPLQSAVVADAAELFVSDDIGSREENPNEKNRMKICEQKHKRANACFRTSFALDAKEHSTSFRRSREARARRITAATSGSTSFITFPLDESVSSHIRTAVLSCWRW